MDGNSERSQINPSTSGTEIGKNDNSHRKMMTKKAEGINSSGGLPKGYKIPVIRRDEESSSSARDPHGRRPNSNVHNVHDDVQHASARRKRDRSPTIRGLESHSESEEGMIMEGYGSSDDDFASEAKMPVRHSRDLGMSSSPSDEDSGRERLPSGTELSESESDSKERKRRKRQKHGKRDSTDDSDSDDDEPGGKRQRYDPCPEDSEHAWKLPKGPEKYVVKHFTEFLSEDKIKKVLKDTPVPKNKIFTVPKLKSEMAELLPRFAREQVAKFDESLSKAQLRLMQVAGPLTSLWQTFEKAANGKSEALNAVDLTDTIEKAILLLGQAWVWTNYSRRLNYMTRFLNSHKRAHTVIKENGEILAKNRKDLFGKKFYTALHKKAKTTKKAIEIRKGLTHRDRRFQTRPSSAYRGLAGANKRQFPQRDQTRGTSSNGGYKKKTPQRGGKKRYVQVIGTRVGVASGSGSPRPITASKNTGRACSNVRKHSNCRSHARTKKHENAPTTSIGGTGGRKDKIMPSKLAKSNKRPCDLGSSEGVPNRLARRPATGEAEVFLSKVLRKRNTRNRFRNRKNAGQKGDHGSFRPKRGQIHKSPVSAPKERWDIQTGVQFKESESTDSVRALQDGNSRHAQEYDSEKRLDGQDRPKGCVFLRANEPKLATVPVFPMEGQDIQISRTPVWLGPSTPPIHQDHESPSRAFETVGNQNNDLSRRHHSAASISRNAEKAGCISVMAIASLGVEDQLAEVHPGTLPSDGFIPRVHHRHHPDAIPTSTGQNKPDPVQMSGCVGGGTDLSPRIGNADRQTSGDSKRSVAGTIILSQPANVEKMGPSEIGTKLWGNSAINTRVQSRSDVVATESGSLQWQSDNLTQREHNYYNRCFESRVGGGSRGHKIDGTGSMDSGGNKAAHKPTGIEDSGVSHQGTGSRSQTVSYPPADRQHNSGGTNQPHGGDQITKLAGGSQDGLGTLHGAKHLAHSRTLTGDLQCRGRQGLQSVRGLERLEIEPPDFQSDRKQVRGARYRLVCQPSQCAQTKICELETRPRCNELRCIRNDLEQNKGIRFPPVLSIGAVLSQSNTGQSNVNNDSTGVAKPTMVPMSVDTASGGAHLASPNVELAQKCTRGEAPTHIESVNVPGSLANLRRSGGPPEFSETAAELYRGSWRAGTEAAYDTAWKRWSSWCYSREVNPVQATVAHIGNFLSTEYELGKAYNTINGYRSAISARHPNVDGMPAGRHPDIVRVMGGIFNKRPPVPRYVDTWEVDKVLETIKALGANDSMDMKCLTSKLAMLMALSSASRGSELSKLKISNKTRQNKDIVFQLDTVTKTVKPGKALLKLTFAKYDPDPLLDVVDCLETYEKRTEPWRVGQQQIDFLFLGLVKPHKPVAPCTIARWLLFIMEKGGVDTSKYKAHSTRAASTSKARVQGLSVEQIVKKANWAKASTFSRFYNREVVPQETAFQDKVLSLERL